MLSDNDLFATCIADEASGEPYEGKVAVAKVIRNRMNLHYESDGTVPGTVLKHFQFSGFWFTMVAGKYKEIEFDLAGAEAQAQRLFEEFSIQSIWADCVKSVQDSLPNSGFIGGPEFQKLDGEAVLYFNPKVCAAPEWATPDKLEAVIFRHNFYRS